MYGAGRPAVKGQAGILLELREFSDPLFPLGFTPGQRRRKE
jgi:hypothetical protein